MTNDYYLTIFLRVCTDHSLSVYYPPRLFQSTTFPYDKMRETALEKQSKIDEYDFDSQLVTCLSFFIYTYICCEEGFQRFSCLHNLSKITGHLSQIATNDSFDAHHPFSPSFICCTFLLWLM